MIHTLAASLLGLKRELQKGSRCGTPDVLPVSKSESFPIDAGDLERMHVFAERNPIYGASHEETIGSTDCIVYEGDADVYWFSSIGHKHSRAPFSPTWMLSGYVLALFAKRLGFCSMVDIGSGDGRIAFCSSLLGMDPFSIEIDGTLAGLQRGMSELLGFEPYCADAASFDYSSLGLESPAFAVGGLAQMGGSDLAAGVMARVNSCDMRGQAGWIFAGTYSPKYAPDPRNEAGWGTVIGKNGLAVAETVLLPTAWTLYESDATPYVFAVNRNPN